MGMGEIKDERTTFLFPVCLSLISIDGGLTRCSCSASLTDQIILSAPVGGNYAWHFFGWSGERRKFSLNFIE